MPFVIAAAVSLVGTAALIRVAPRIGLVDRPGELKVHLKAVPYGGAALAVGALAGALVAGGNAWMVLAVLVALAGGLVDDIHPISPWARLPAQLIAGLCLVLGGLTLEPLGAAGPVVLVIATVACCNAVNMIDGQDGLAPGLGAIAGLGLAGVALAAGTSSATGLAVAGACSAFLLWNRPPARVFLGDGGAYAVGVLLVASAASASTGWPELLGVTVCLGLFVAELVSTVLRRIRSASSALLGDREHTYDRLALLLGSRRRCTVLLWSVGAGLALAAQCVARLEIGLSVALAAVWGVAIVIGQAAVAKESTLLREESG